MPPSIAISASIANGGCLSNSGPISMVGFFFQSLRNESGAALMPPL